SSTTNAHPCAKPADGACVALARTRSSRSAGTERSSKLRTIRRRRTTSWKSMSSHCQEPAPGVEGAQHEPQQRELGERVRQRTEGERGPRDDRPPVDFVAQVRPLDQVTERLGADEGKDRVATERVERAEPVAADVDEPVDAGQNEQRATAGEEDVRARPE